MSQSINDGGPAFPTNETNYEAKYCGNGMSLRDYFATTLAPELIKKNTGCGTAWNYVARDAYAAADAMLVERAKGTK